MELDSRCEVVTSDKKTIQQNVCTQGQITEKFYSKSGLFYSLHDKISPIFLLVDIYTMHRINTFSVIFRVSVKLSEV